MCGCTVGPNYHASGDETPPAYKEVAGLEARRNPMTRISVAKWWTLFKDPQLNDLEAQVRYRTRISKRPRRSISRHEPRFATTRADYVSDGYRRPFGKSDANFSQPALRQAPPSTASPTTILCCHSISPMKLTSGDEFDEPSSGAREQAQASAADLATVNLSMHADLAVDYFEARSLDAEDNSQSTVVQYRTVFGIDPEPIPRRTVVGGGSPAGKDSAGDNPRRGNRRWRAPRPI